jgi:hypothetical protein
LFLKYFKNKCEDKEILPVIEFALSLSGIHIQKSKDLFTNEKIPIPVGFTDEDVNVNAPKLFTDTFMLYYIQNMSVIGMAGAVVGIAICAREDISKFFQKILMEGTELHDMPKEGFIIERYLHKTTIHFKSRQGSFYI